MKLREEQYQFSDEEDEIVVLAAAGVFAANEVQIEDVVPESGVQFDIGGVVGGVDDCFP